MLAIQQRLAALGYLNGSADGDFGGQTLAAVQALQTAHGLAADDAITEKEIATLKEDIRIQASRAIAVAMTNAESPDVFADDGSTYDTGKFHSYTYITGIHAKVVKEGAWTETAPYTWHVEDIRLKMISAEDTYLDLTLDVTFTGTSYVLSGVTRTMGPLAALDAGDATQLSVDQLEPSESAPYLTVSPALLDVGSVLPAGIALEHDTARLVSVEVDHDGQNDNTTTLVYFGDYRYPEYIQTKRPEGDTDFELFPVDGRIYAEIGNGFGIAHWTSYLYNSDHTLARETFDYLSDGEMKPADISTYEYDSQGRRSGMDWAPARVIEGDQVKYSLHYAYTYNESGQFAKEERISYFTSHLVRTDEYQYSEQGEQIGSVSSIYDSETGKLESALVTNIYPLDVPVLNVRYCEEYTSDAMSGGPTATLYMTLNNPYGDKILEYSIQADKVNLTLNANGYLVKAVDNKGTEITFRYENQPSDSAQELEVTADTSIPAETQSTLEGVLATAIEPEPTPTPEPPAAPEPIATPEPTGAPVVHQTTYVLNTNTYKFHLQGCRSVKKMKESNTAYFTGTRDEVLQMGYIPCSICNP